MKQRGASLSLLCACGRLTGEAKISSMSAVNSARRPVFLAVLLLAAAIVPAAAQEPILVRLRDAVGDTIDRAERDSFNLFPKTAEFHDAVVLALPGPEFFAEIRRTGTDSTRNIFLRIIPNDLERIRFLIDNHDYVAAQQRSDSTYAQALAAFWQTIEDSPLRNMAGEPAIVREVPPAPPEVVPPSEPATAQEVHPEPPEAVTAGEPLLQPVTSENRYNYTLLGTTLGSVAGGLLGSAGSGCAYGVSPPLSQPVFLTVAFGATALGSYAGYKYGNRLDRKSVAQPLPSEGRGWRTCCAIVACVPGLTLGAVTGAFIGTAANGGNLTWIPAILSGLCVTVEVVTLGYQMGRLIDRNNAH